MTSKTIHDRAGEVSAEDGVVHLDGPDHVDVDLTPDAAEEISERLLEGVLKARGQIFFADKQRRRD